MSKSKLFSFLFHESKIRKSSLKEHDENELKEKTLTYKFLMSYKQAH